VYRYYIFLIHSSVVGHFGCFHNLAIMNSPAINVILLFYGFETYRPECQFTLEFAPNVCNPSDIVVFLLVSGYMSMLVSEYPLNVYFFSVINAFISFPKRKHYLMSELRQLQDLVISFCMFRSFLYSV
jgi:hypothetical protein